MTNARRYSNWRVYRYPLGFLHVQLPLEVKLAFKAHCAKRNISMQKKIQHMIEDLLANEGRVK